MKNFQSKSVEQGDRWHAECIDALRRNGFEIAEERMRLKDVGVELDAVTNNKWGIAMAWEFKGSWEGFRPGLTRTDTLKKAVANAWLLSQSQDYADRFPPLLVMTTHEPEDGSCLTMMHIALSKALITYVTDDRNNTFLRWLYQADEALIFELIEWNRKKPMPDASVQKGRKFPRHAKQKTRSPSVSVPTVETEGTSASTKIARPLARGAKPIANHPRLFSMNGDEEE